MEGSLNGLLAPLSRPGLHGESRGQLICLLLCSEAAAQTKLRSFVGTNSTNYFYYCGDAVGRISFPYATSRGRSIHTFDGCTAALTQFPKGKTEACSSRAPCTERAEEPGIGTAARTWS